MRVTDLLARRRARRLHERDGADDLAGRAEAALQRVGAHERVDHRMVAQPLDRRHLGALDRVRERDARERRRAVDEHRAGAAMPFAAGDLRPGQRQLVAQRLGERRADGRVHLVDVVVDRSAQAPVVTASMSARWISRNVSRVAHAPVACRPRSREARPQVARGHEQLVDPVDRVGVAVALRAGVDREAEHADRVRLPRPEERRRHREVLVDARELQRLRERLVAVRRRRLGSGCPSASAFAVLRASRGSGGRRTPRRARS